MIKDHLGNEYKTISDMCRAYGIKVNLYYSRLRSGWSLERILTTKVNWGKSVYDHKGNEYKTLDDMCKAYGINQATYSARRSIGWSVADSLEKPLYPSKGKKCKDHLGREYDSIKSLCNAYGISYDAVKGRMKHGFTLEEALMTEVGYMRKCKDHLGREYKSVTEMCNAYNINVSTFRHRINNGWKLADALKRPVIDSKDITGRRLEDDEINTYAIDAVYDHLGKAFTSETAMCKYYNIPIKLFKLRLDSGWTLGEALTIKNNIEPNSEVYC